MVEQFHASAEMILSASAWAAILGVGLGFVLVAVTTILAACAK